MIDVRDDDKVADMRLLHGVGREPNTVLVSAMLLRRVLLLGAFAALVACQAPVPPTPTPALVVATAVPVATAPQVGISRIEVLNSANTAFRSGDFSAAAGLYDRVVNTPPGPGEAAAASSAITDFARFRGMITLLADGREDEARARLAELQQRDPNAALARLGSQLYDQYGMTGQLRGACAQLQPQVASQAGPTLATLQGLGVTIDASTLCSVPQG